MARNKKTGKKSLARASARANPGEPFDWTAEHEKVLLLFSPGGLLKDKDRYQPVVAAFADLFGIKTTVDVVKKRHVALSKVQKAFEARYGGITAQEARKPAQRPVWEEDALEEDPGVTSSEESPAASRPVLSSSSASRGTKRAADGQAMYDPVRDTKRVRMTEPLPRAAFLAAARALERKKHEEAASVLASLSGSGALPPERPAEGEENGKEGEEMGGIGMNREKK